MRFADPGLTIAWILVALWTLAATGWFVVPRRSARRCVPNRGLGPVMAGSGVAVVAFAGQAAVVDAVEDASAISRFDGPLLGWMLAHRTDVLTASMKAISAAGGTLRMSLLAAVGAAALVLGRRRTEAGVVLAGLGAVALSSGFKILYGRVRPPLADQITASTTFSLPSGHALGSIVVLGVLTVAGILATHGRFLRVGMVGLAAQGVTMIGVSRLYLGVHWLTDVPCRLVVGGGVAGGVFFGTRAGHQAPGEHRPCPPGPLGARPSCCLLLPDVCQRGGRASSTRS